MVPGIKKQTRAAAIPTTAKRIPTYRTVCGFKIEVSIREEKERFSAEDAEIPAIAEAANINNPASKI